MQRPFSPGSGAGCGPSAPRPSPGRPHGIRNRAPAAGPYDDREKAIAFYRDALGFEARNDVSAYGMRWATPGSPVQPDASVVLEPPAADPGISPSDREAIADLLAKGLLGRPVLAPADVDAAFERALATGAEVVQEPTDQPYGIRDCAFRDPAGNLIRISQPRR